MKTETTKNILDLTFMSGDLGIKVSVRKFFYLLMEALWDEKDDFSGKRPFGNSGWDGDLIKCLIENEKIKGILDEDGYIDSYDKKQLNEVVYKDILKPLFGVK